jgi:DNA polymerase elongation subunit (family B)
VYGDTDSIFVVFPNSVFEPTDDISFEQMQTFKGKSKIMPSIAAAIKASGEFKHGIKAPHDLEYEKTFWPFVLLSKKRYVGNVYEKDDRKCKQKSMGIVLKRRDNAPIVKRIYGGIIDIILGKQNVQESIDFLTTTLKELVDGTCPLEDLIISKSLRAEYKDPTRIAHKVLAERIGQRDPGNKPQVNDRIPFVYICPPQTFKSKVKVLQGNRIEHPDFIRKNKIKPDYAFYITNQIMKPVLQVYGVIAEQVRGNKHGLEFYQIQRAKLMAELKDETRVQDKISQMKEEDVQMVLFNPILTKLENIRNKNKEITEWFKPLQRL